MKSPVDTLIEVCTMSVEENPSRPGTSPVTPSEIDRRLGTVVPDFVSTIK